MICRFVSYMVLPVKQHLEIHIKWLWKSLIVFSLFYMAGLFYGHHHVITISCIFHDFLYLCTIKHKQTSSGKIIFIFQMSMIYECTLHDWTIIISQWPTATIKVFYHHWQQHIIKKCQFINIKIYSYNKTCWWWGSNLCLVTADVLRDFLVRWHVHVRTLIPASTNRRREFILCVNKKKEAIIYTRKERLLKTAEKERLINIKWCVI